MLARPQRQQADARRRAGRGRQARALREAHRQRRRHLGQNMEATVTEAQRAAPPPRDARALRARSRPQLTERFGYTNPMQVPRLEKVTLNMGIGEAKHDDRRPRGRHRAARHDRRPAAERAQARKSIANFKLREGMPVGVSVTLRGARMWEFAGPPRLDRDPADPRLPRAQPALVRRPRQLLAGRSRAADLPRDRLRLDRQVRGLDMTFTTTAATDEEGSSCCSGSASRSPQEGRPGGRPRSEDAEEERRERGGAAARRGRAGGPRAAQGGEP